MSERTNGGRIPHNDRRPFTPRKALALPREMYSEEGRAFFLTTRALGGTRPFATPERCRIVLERLAAQRSALGCWVGAYCLMPDHLHFVSGPGPTGRSVLDLLRRLHGASTNALWKTFTYYRFTNRPRAGKKDERRTSRLPTSLDVTERTCAGMGERCR